MRMANRLSGAVSAVAANATARLILATLVLAITFFFLGREIASNWSNLESDDLGFEPIQFVAGSVLAACGFIALGAGWFAVVAYLSPGRTLSAARFLRIFLLTWIGRYVPGKLAFWAGKIYLARREGPSTEVLVVGTAYENLIFVAVALLLSSVTVVPTLAFGSEAKLALLALPVIAVLVAAGLHPRFAGRLIGLALRVMGREEERQHALVLPVRGLIMAGGAYLLAALLMGTGFFLFSDSLADISVGDLPYTIGLFNLAIVAGMVVFVVPSGIGVREGALVGMLQHLMPLEVALAVSVAARLWTVAIDVLLFGLAATYDHLLADQVGWSTIIGRSTATRPGAEQ